MRRKISIIRKVLLASISLLLVVGPTGTVFADSTDPCTPPPSSQNGVRWPVGSDAGTFIYQCDGPYSGKWINNYYLYNPSTNTRSALYDPAYFYDCSTKQWYMTSWDYSPAKAAYSKNIVATSDPGDIATNCPTPALPANTETGSSNSARPSLSDGTSSSTAASSGSSASASADTASSSSANTAINNASSAAMNNGVISFANSGNSVVSSNTTGGSASTGNSQVVANIINLLQSSSNILETPHIITFTADINGDINGDLLLDPSKLSSIQPANSSNALDSSLAVNNASDASIKNDVSLGANSGNADVSHNTSAGSATSGNANAVANIVNILNSAVTAGQSFLGVININGNLNGDILLPPNFVDTLLASNVPRYTINKADINTSSTTTNSTNQSINNAIQAVASTGKATVSDNTSAGNATSGSANTNLTVFNLTGSDVVASNNLLVFINVLGTWYGLIMNAPAGTTAASLGGGVSHNTIRSNADISNTTNQSITNNVRVASRSGDATVAQNTSAGDATSGDATASVNLVNMINDSISLNGWFGLLFINVFGTWNGSFGINTSAGDPSPSANYSPTTITSVGGTNPVNQLHVFTFIPKASTGSLVTSYGNAGDASIDSNEAPSIVLASHTTKKPDLGKAILPGTDAIHPNMSIVIIGAALALLILAFGERHWLRQLFRH